MIDATSPTVATQPTNMPKKWANLPLIRGVYKCAEPLDRYTTFRIGGPAEILYTPADLADLANFWRQQPQDIELTLLGEGSNILIRDGGIPGVVIHIGPGCDAVTLDGTLMRAEAGASTGKVARMARQAELTNAEFICGIPGSIGGALKMNAGCYGSELIDILEAVEVITHTGEHRTVSPQELGFAYRTSALPEGWIFAAAHLRLQPGNRDDIREKMRTVNHNRAASQPLELPNAGSLFKNPEGPKKAWQLIEGAGCRGLRKGDAQVSEKHCNFFVNLGKATAADMEDLAEDVRARVLAQTGVNLVWEVKVLGTRKCAF